jgi:REP element-mobilizing transposase RayT
MRLCPGLPSLRSRKYHAIVRRALARLVARDKVRVVEYSVLSNHLHFIVEAKHASALSRGMQALAIRIAKGLNRVSGRNKGRVFEDRFHCRILKTPLEVKRALVYVINNFRRHAWQAGRKIAAAWIDPCSSGPWFDGFCDRQPRRSPQSRVHQAPRTWLAREGWKVHGRFAVAKVPG